MHSLPHRRYRSPAPRALRLRLPWPVPAVLAWAGAWLAWRGALAAGVPPGWAWLMAAALGLALALPNAGPWRRGIAAAGFPLASWLAGAAAAPPAWAWLLPALPLALLYPLRAWRDAPFFPTPQGALQGLEGIVQPPPARVLDAGCGLGHGLRALGRCWPAAALTGIEWSPLLARLARWRCREARVLRGDLWAAPWGEHELVYLFQRPESMARAWAKACADMAGGWLVSLEFPVPGVVPAACLAGADGRPLWVYRVPGRTVRPITGALSGSTAGSMAVAAGR